MNMIFERSRILLDLLFTTLCLASTVSSEVYLDTTCDSVIVERAPSPGESCTMFCQADGYRENQVLVVAKEIRVDTLGSWVDSESFDIYRSDTGFSPEIEESGRYKIDIQDDRTVKFTFADVHLGDGGRYTCHTEVNGNIQETSRLRGIKVKDRDIDISASIAKKKAKYDREIDFVYENNTFINITSWEYELLALYIEVNDMLVYQLDCKIFAQTENNSEELRWMMMTEPDVSNYTPKNALPTSSDLHYTQIAEIFDFPEADHFVLEAKCFGSFDMYATLPYRVEVELQRQNAAPTITSTAILILPVVYFILSNI